MIDPEIIKRIKADWQLILGSDGCGKGAVCPACGSGSGKNGTGLSEVPGTEGELKCFACGQSHDVIHWHCIKNGLDPTGDFKRAVAECAALIGISLDQPVSNNHTAMKKVYDSSEMSTITAARKAYFDECAARLDQTDYHRGLSEETLKHFKVGFDPAWKHPDWSKKCSPTPRLIIPVNEIAYIARLTREPHTQFERDKAKVKVSKPHKLTMFNASALKSEVLIVVEGEIDAMSIFDVGFHNVIGLGSISMVKEFFRELEICRQEGHRYPRAVIVALDNEIHHSENASKNVHNAREALRKGLGVHDIAFVDGTALSGEYKDANELLNVDREQLKRNVQALIDQAQALPPVEHKPKAQKKEPEGAPAFTGHVQTKSVIPTCPINLTVPDDFDFTSERIYSGKLCICRNPVLPTKKIVKHSDRTVKYGIGIMQEDGHWEELITEASTILNASKLIELTDCGILTNSGKAVRELTTYFRDMIAMNASVLPKLVEYDQPGWTHDLTDFPLPCNNKFYMPALRDIFEQRGSLETWLDMAKAVVKSPVAAIMLAASLAPPLLRILDMRSFVIYLYGTSRFGKSASQSFAISAWGVPKRQMATFNATANGLESVAARSNDLPLMIDESTEADKKKLNLQMIPYLLAGGQGKTRMNRDLTARPTKQWLTIGLTNGEDALFDDVSKMGAMNRVLEIRLNVNERIFKDESAAADVHKFASKHCGLLGQDFIARLKQVSDGDYGVVHTYYNQFYKYVNEVDEEHVLEHIRLICVLLTAWALFQVWYMGVPENEVILKTLEGMGNDLLTRLPTMQEVDEGRRAWAQFIEYIQAHKYNFVGEHLIDGEKSRPVLTPIMGALDHEKAEGEGSKVKEARVLSSMAKKILTDMGFSANKLLKEFAQRGWTDAPSGSINIVRKWEGKSQRMVVIPGVNFTPNIS